MNKKECHLKKSNDELQEYLLFKRRGSCVEAKKGKGAKYKRNPKHKKGEYENV